MNHLVQREIWGSGLAPTSACRAFGAQHALLANLKQGQNTLHSVPQAGDVAFQFRIRLVGRTLPNPLNQLKSELAVKPALRATVLALGIEQNAYTIR